MTIDPDNLDSIVNSVLTIRSIGSVQNIDNELLLPDGKTIQELLDDQKEKNNKEDIS